MNSFLNNSILKHKSKPPLRWAANLSGNIASHALLKASFLDEDSNWNRRYDFYIKVYDIFMPLWYKYGSYYELDIDMSGKGWDDYDENGVPYWEKTGVVDPDYSYDEFHWDYIDEETGDAFKVINYGRP